MRVLIVDDEPLARARLRGLLSRVADVEIVGEAADGAAALHACDTHRPELVMLDIRMPGIDGLEVARQLGAQTSPPPWRRCFRPLQACCRSRRAGRASC